MNHRVNTIACALLISAFGASAAQASDQRSPVAGQGAAQTQVFAGLGHEGSGLHNQGAHTKNVLAGLGREGSGLHGKRKSASATNVFANLGIEGSGLIARWEALRHRPWAS
jgi:hypothetical protein